MWYSCWNGTGFLNVPLDDWSRLDYNLYGQSNGIEEIKIVKFEGFKTMSQMQILGAELHGIDRQNPLFNTPFSNLHLQNGSPALNSDINLGNPFNRDKNGVERPRNGN